MSIEIFVRDVSAPWAAHGVFDFFQNSIRHESRGTCEIETGRKPFARIAGNLVGKRAQQSLKRDFVSPTGQRVVTNGAYSTRLERAPDKPPQRFLIAVTDPRQQPLCRDVIGLRTK